MSIWFAPTPALPPEPQLGRVVADWRPSQVRSVLSFCLAAVFGVSVAVLLAFEAYSFAAVTLFLGLLWALAWIGVRRTYLAVGDDWLYVRTLPAGAGWTPLSGLESGTMTGKHRTTLLLRGSGFRGRLPVPDVSQRTPSTFHGELARRVLARSPELDDQARFVLRAWAGLVDADAGED